MLKPRGLTPEQKLLRKRFIDPNDCWLWQGAISDKGYGTTTVNSKTVNVHKLAHLVWKGPVRDQVLHTCDVRHCFNPRHLYDGTHEQNMLDRQERRRQAKGPRISQAKFTNKQVKDLRAEYQSGKFTQAELGKKYGVGQNTISRIVNNLYYTEA